MAETADPEPRWRRRRDDRPGEIADAALALFTEHGFAATRLEAVAQAAGVTKGTIYLYFENKEDLFRSAVRDRIVPRIERGEAAVAEHHGTAQALLRQLFREWAVDFLDPSRGKISKLIVSEASRFPALAQFFTEEVAQRGRRLFVGVIERGIADGEFRAVDVEAVARLAVAPVIHYAIHHQSLGAYDADLAADRYLDAHVDLFVRGLLRVSPDA